MNSLQTGLPRLVICYNTRFRLLRLWRPTENGPLYMPALLRTLLRAMQKHRAQQLLLNMQHLPPIGLELQRWLQTSWLPQLRETSLTRLAVLLPTQVYNRVMVEGLLLASAEQSPPYEVQYFSELSAALDWLMDAELPSTEQDWQAFWRTPALVRSYHLRRRWQRV